MLRVKTCIFHLLQHISKIFQEFLCCINKLGKKNTEKNDSGILPTNFNKSVKHKQNGKATVKEKMPLAPPKKLFVAPYQNLVPSGLSNILLL